jgi:Malate/L-lactate dehydrogenase
MPMDQDRPRTAAPISVQQLTSFGAAVLVAVGVPDADARLVADSLVTADLWGHQSHGVLRLSWYVNRIRAGAMAAVTTPETVSDAGALLVVDGHDGVGQVLAAHAARQAVGRARTHGVGVVAVRNSNHFGTAAYFTRMAARDGCVAILTTNASPAMAPPGAAAARPSAPTPGRSPPRPAATTSWSWTSPTPPSPAARCTWLANVGSQSRPAGPSTPTACPPPTQRPPSAG